MPAFSKQNILDVLDALKHTDFDSNAMLRHSQESPHLFKYFHSLGAGGKGLSIFFPNLRWKDIKRMSFFTFSYIFSTSIALSVYHIKSIR